MESGKRKRICLALTAVLMALCVALTGSLAGCGKREKEKDVSSSSTSDDEREEPVDQDPDEEDEDPSGEEEPEGEDEESGEEDDGQSSSSSAPSSGGSSGPSGGSAQPSAPQTPAPAPSQPSASAPAVSSKPSQSSKPSTSSKPSQSSKPTSSKEDYEAEPTDITYRDEGSYSQKATYRDGTIRGDNITLRNKTFTGDLTITSAAGKKDISLENVVVKGTLTVNGGSGWIKLYDTRIGELEVDKAGAKVFASKGTDVRKVTVKKSAVLQEGTLSSGSDGFENITVKGSSRSRTDLTLQKADVEQITIETQSWVSLDKDSQVQRISANAPTYVKGSGDVEELTASNDYVYYQNKPSRVTSKGGARKPRKYQASDNYWSGGDEDSDGSYGDDYDSDRDDVYIKWVDSVSDYSISDGITDTVRLSSNATRITAQSSNSHIVGVSVDDNDDLVLRARDTGSAKITVTGKRSGYNSLTRTFRVEVTEEDTTNPNITKIDYSIPQDGSHWTSGTVEVTVSVTDEHLDTVTVPGYTVGRVREGLYRFTVAQNGNYEITARDKAGNTSRKTATVRSIDKTAPSINITSPQPLVAPVTIQFEVEDKESGVSKVMDRTISPAVSRAASSYTANTPGDYTLRAWDQAGNPVTKLVKVQSPSAPVLNVVNLQLPSAWGQNQDVSFQVQSSGSGAIEVKVNNTLLSLNALDGRYHFTANQEIDYVITAASGGNSATLTVTKDQTKVDTTDPFASLTFDVAPRVLSVTASDARSGVSSVVLTNPSGTTVASWSGGGTFSHAVPEGDSGVYRLTVTDNVGRAVTAEATVAAAAAPDTTPPIIQVTQGAGREIAWASTQQVTITVRDDESGVESASVTPTGGGTLHQTKDGPTYKEYVYETDNENDTLSVTAEDNAGWQSTQSYTVQRVDATAPAVSFSMPAGAAQASITVTDPRSGLQSVSFDGQPQTVTLGSASQAFSYTPPAGAAAVTVSAQDQAGNLFRKQFEIPKETTPPVVTFSASPNGWAREKTVTVRVTDAQSGVKSVVINGVQQTLSDNGVYIYKAEKENEAIKVQAADHAGNVTPEAGATYTVQKVDRTNPAAPSVQYSKVVNGVSTPQTLAAYVSSPPGAPHPFDKAVTLSIVAPVENPQGSPVSTQYKLTNLTAGTPAAAEYTTGVQVQLPQSSADTTYQLKVRCADQAGNDSAEVEYRILIRAPAASPVSSGSKETKGQASSGKKNTSSGKETVSSGKENTSSREENTSSDQESAASSGQGSSSNEQEEKSSSD